jgi:hypothetical protein
MRISGRTRRGSLALVTASALVLTAACSSDDDDAADTETVLDSGRDDEAATEDTTDESEESEAGEAETEGSGSERPSQALATVEGTAPWVQLEILDLRRVDDKVTVEFVITTGPELSLGTRPDFADPQDQDNELPAQRRYSVSGVTLVDTVNSKRHLTLRDSEGNCLCTAFEDQLPEPETRHPHSADFPAPPDDVEEMTVDVPHFPTIDNVPLRTS